MVEIYIPTPTELISPPESQLLTPEHAAKLFFHSYRHSQGFPQLQRMIFSFIARTNPDWHLSDSEAQELATITRQKITGYAVSNNHQDISGKDIDSDIVDRIDDFKSALNSGDHSLGTPQTLAMHIIRQDARFMARAEGRHERKNNSQPSQTDKWFSFACHFGLNGNPTGISEFDRMYHDINDYLRAPTLDMDRQTDSAFDMVLRAHNANHPGQEIKW